MKKLIIGLSIAFAFVGCSTTNTLIGDKSKSELVDLYNEAIKELAETKVLEINTTEVLESDGEVSRTKKNTHG